MVIDLSFLITFFIFLRDILLLVDVLVCIFPLLSYFINPIIIFRIPPINNNLFKLFLIHLVFLIICEVLVLSLLPILYQLAEIIVLIVLFAYFTRLQHDIFCPSMNYFVEASIYY